MECKSKDYIINEKVPDVKKIIQLCTDMKYLLVTVKKILKFKYICFNINTFSSNTLLSKINSK